MYDKHAMALVMFEINDVFTGGPGDSGTRTEDEEFGDDD